MNIAERIKKAREAKGLSQKEVALALKMDQSQYSRIENDKVDPQFSTVEKIADAIGVAVADLMAAEDVFKDVASFDKTLVEKLQLVEQLDDTERKSLFSIIDGLVTKQRLRQSLAAALSL